MDHGQRTELSRAEIYMAARTMDRMGLSQSFIAAKFGDASAYASEDGRSVPLDARNHDLHFAGRFDIYLRWILFCAEVNYAGFFDTERRKAIGADFARLTTTATNGATTSPTTG